MELFHINQVHQVVEENSCSEPNLWGLHFLLQQVRNQPTSLPDLRGKGHKHIRTSSGKNHRITVDTSKSWTWQLWQCPFGPCRLLYQLSRTKCTHHRVSVKWGNQLALLLRLKTQGLQGLQHDLTVQTIRLFHLTSIISLLKARDSSDDFHIKHIKERMGKASTNMRKSSFGVTVDKIFLKQGWEGQNDLILNLLPATIIQQNILADV